MAGVSAIALQGTDHLLAHVDADLNPSEGLRIYALDGIYDERRNMVFVQMRANGADLVGGKVLCLIYDNYVVPLTRHVGRLQGDIVPVDLTKR